jgi:hypothetical protein
VAGRRSEHDRSDEEAFARIRIYWGVEAAHDWYRPDATVRIRKRQSIAVTMKRTCCSPRPFEGSDQVDDVC